MNPLAPATCWLALAGWSVIAVLWHTSVVALTVATWRQWRPDAPARTQYRGASAAFVIAVVLTLATPAVLLIRPSVPPSLARAAMTGVPAQAGPGQAAPIGSAAGGHTSARRLAALIAPWVGIAWCLGFAVGVIRLGGGWGLALWIRRRAVEVRSARVLNAAAVASETWELPLATVLSSAHVEAPVVIGARSPTVLLPIDLEQRLDADALPPLLAHELAHVARRDYAANLLQSLADAVLFFSPGAVWLSRRVREAREYCCDDVVAARCATGAYVSALTTLARLGVAARTRPSVNAAGPRLITRIRRLLKAETMTPIAGYRIAGLGGALALAAAAGYTLVPLSAQGVARSAPARFSAPIQGPIPRGFVATQPGAAVALRDVTTSDAATCGTATVENLANVAVTGLRFAAFAQAGGPEGSSLATSATQTSELLTLDVAPGGTGSVDVGLMSLDALRQTMRTGSPQVMCALAEIRYANGAQWTAPPATVFGPQQAEVSRALLDGARRPGAPLCADDRGFGYSEGAVVPIAMEPGTFARCGDGAWTEYELPRMQPDPAR